MFPIKEHYLGLCMASKNVMHYWRPVRVFSRLQTVFNCSTHERMKNDTYL